MIRVPVMIHLEGTKDALRRQHLLPSTTEAQRAQRPQRKTTKNVSSVCSVSSVSLW